VIFGLKENHLVTLVPSESGSGDYAKDISKYLDPPNKNSGINS
jgi:hypothetical protein